MSNDTDFIGEGEIDYAEVLSRGGANCGDEDFAVFACPFCRHVYLLEYEADTAYLDAHDLRKRVSVFNTGFACVSCGKEIPSDSAWVGPRAPEKFRVLREEMSRSGWRWILKRGPIQSLQRNAGSRPFSGDSSASETPSSLGPRG